MNPADHEACSREIGAIPEGMALAKITDAASVHRGLNG